MIVKILENKEFKLYLIAANNIKQFAFCKNNTAGTAGINACVDMNHIIDSDQEAPSFMGV